jgi:hypothetical protein
MILDSENTFIFNKKNEIINHINSIYNSDDEDYEGIKNYYNTKAVIQTNVGYASDFEDDDIINQSNYNYTNKISECSDEYLLINLFWYIIILIIIVLFYILLIFIKY